MLTVKSISNQDWNLFYDHGQWTSYCWSHKWCHISAFLCLPICKPEMPILIKNCNLKDKVSLADSEMFSFVLLLLLRLRAEQKKVCIPLSTIWSLWWGKPKINLQFTPLKQVWCEAEKSTGLELALGNKVMSPTCVQHNPKLCTSNTTVLGLGSPLPYFPPQYHWACLKSAVLSLVLLLFLLAMGKTQDSLKTGVLGILYLWVRSQGINFTRGFTSWSDWNQETFATFLFMVHHLVNTR